MYDAILIYSKAVSSSVIDIEVPVFVDIVDVYGQEFYLSYQSGINVTMAFEVNKYDFEETKHIEQDTNKILYAAEILYEGAKYNIVRHQQIKDSDKILIICS